MSHYQTIGTFRVQFLTVDIKQNACGSGLYIRPRYLKTSLTDKFLEYMSSIFGFHYLIIQASDFIQETMNTYI